MENLYTEKYKILLIKKFETKIDHVHRIGAWIFLNYHFLQFDLKHSLILSKISLEFYVHVDELIIKNVMETQRN